MLFRSGPASGYLVVAIGWAPFFLFTFLIALPGLWLLSLLRVRLEPAPRAAAAR